MINQEQAINNSNTKSYKHSATHEASKFVTPVRFISLLPSPVDQSSMTLKSVHWNWSDPIFPEQPVRQVKTPGSPIKVPEYTVSALQKAVPLRQAIR